MPQHRDQECTLTARSCLQDFFAKWGQEGTIDFAKTFSELIILTASRTLMGMSSCCISHVPQSQGGFILLAVVTQPEQPHHNIVWTYIHFDHKVELLVSSLCRPGGEGEHVPSGGRPVP